MKPVIFIVGVTGSGKSRYAYELAKSIHGELISADSRQIYKRACIGTNKTIFPDIQTHLLDCIEPEEQYSAYRFAQEAGGIIRMLQKRNIPPIIVGGTSYYIDTLLGKSPTTSISRNYVETMRGTLGDISLRDLQELFYQHFPAEYNALNNSEKQNYRRLVKNYIHTCFIQEYGPQVQKKFLPEGNRILKFGITLSKEERDALIMQRTKQMILAGLKNEAAALLEKYGQNNVLVQSIGYKEYIDTVKRKDSSGSDVTIAKMIRSLSEEDELAVSALITLHTRQYARKQMTWLKRDKEIVWIKKIDDLIAKVIYD